MNSAKPTTWLFDLGNSRLKYAEWRDGALGDVVFVNHDGKSLEEGWQEGLPAQVDAAHVASVAGAPLTEALVAALSRRSRAVAIARTLPACAGVRIAYAHPERLGVDRFLTLLAARARGPGPSLVVGVGTALTIDLLDGKGLHRGGRIAPSPTTMRAMLHARAPQLPAVGGRYVEFATDTDDALVSGCEGAASALVTRSLEAATSLLGVAPDVLVHGGGADALTSRMPGAAFVPAMVLDGLAQWAQCGQGSRG